MKSSLAPAEPDPRANLIGFERTALESFFEELGEKPFRARQIMKWIHERGIVDFQEMTDLSKSLRAKLAQIAKVERLAEVSHQQSADGTCKWLLELDDGNRIETVFIPDNNRGTLCVSSQVGCALNCAFCATARQGFSRNLNSAEIVAQVWHARQTLGEGRISNIVMMGMGEPLLNFDSVVAAMDVMMDDLAYGLSKRRVTVSTAGLVPAIGRLALASPASLAVSLHATTDELRNRLVPINRKYPLAQLMRACQAFLQSDMQRGRKITWEYVLLDGVNDSPEDAHRLVRLLSSIPSKINLIPFNRFKEAPFRCPPPGKIERFQAILQQAGFITTVRKTRGDDIDAACGQLVGKVQARTRPKKPIQLEAVT